MLFALGRHLPVLLETGDSKRVERCAGDSLQSSFFPAFGMMQETFWPAPVENKSINIVVAALAPYLIKVIAI
jgi:hypothetical protein